MQWRGSPHCFMRSVRVRVCPAQKNCSWRGTCVDNVAQFALWPFKHSCARPPTRRAVALFSFDPSVRSLQCTLNAMLALPRCCECCEHCAAGLSRCRSDLVAAASGD